MRNLVITAREDRQIARQARYLLRVPQPCQQPSGATALIPAVRRQCAGGRVTASLPDITTRMSGETTYEIIVRRKHHGHGQHQWAYNCGHPDCGGEGSPAEYPATCRGAACAEKAAWDHARHAHPDDTAVIEIQGDA